MKNWLVTSFVSLALFSHNAHSQSENYCVGIRGNGENVAAHWGALSRIVEEVGMPQAMAGGSSATVSMFLIESIASNPVIKNITESEKRKQAQSLLIKSIPVYLQMVLQHEKAIDAYQFFKELNNVQSPIRKALQAVATGSQNVQSLNKALKKYGPLLNPEILVGLTQNPMFFKEQVADAIKVFGQFDAENDANLFFRPGLIDFKFFALVIGQMADFYAGNFSAQTNQLVRRFVDQCSSVNRKNNWLEINQKQPLCQTLLLAAVNDSLKTEFNQLPHRRIFEPVSKTITAFPTTSIISGQGLLRFNDLLKKFRRGENDDYASFSVDFKQDMNLGYWGKSADLEKVQNGLKSFVAQEDLKSDKFSPLGSANWFEVLATSPAEPGLANIQPILHSTNRATVLAELNKGFNERWNSLPKHEEFVSSGGWSDLHPTLVLKAYGCSNVIYLSRTDGESVFGQQVVIRLTGETEKVPFWKDIEKKNKQGWDSSDFNSKTADSAWNRLYNLGNPESSYKRSIETADVVYCTNWNDFNAFAAGAVPGMIEDAYRAPVYLKENVSSAFQFNPTGEPKPGCH